MSAAPASPPTPPTPPTLEEALRLRATPPRPRRLNRKVLLGGACVLGGLVAFAVLSGLSERPDRRAGAHADEAPAGATAMPDMLRTLPSTYDAASLRPPADDPPHDMLWGERGAPEGRAPPGLEPPEDAFWAEASAPPQWDAAPARPPEPGLDPATAPIFFDARRDRPRAAPTASLIIEAEQSIEGGGRREGFTARQRTGAEILDSPYVGPGSPYLLQAGAVIPAALVTALNSDLPGSVIAQVTAPVFDSVSGEHLLIPQGARLIGTYDSATVYGDDRVFLVWNRLIMPNGWSLQLQGMEATDPTGASGLADRTDNQIDRLAGAIGISAVLSILANEAEGDDADGFSQSVGDAAAQEAARVGGRIIDRQLNLRPTLRVRPGAPVRVLVTRDIQLRPYSP